MSTPVERDLTTSNNRLLFRRSLLGLLRSSRGQRNNVSLSEPVLDNEGRFEAVYRHHGFTRAEFFGISALTALTAACSFEPEPPRSNIRREIGQWTELDITNLANEMFNDESGNIATAGRVLLLSLEGEPAISRLARIYTDVPISISTVNKIDPIYPGLGNHAMLTTTRARGNTEITLKSKIGNEPDLILSAPETLSFERIEIDHSITKNMSDFLLKFYMAKEIFNARTAYLASFYFTRMFVYTFAEEPEDEVTQYAVQRGLLKSDPGDEVPLNFAVDLWAHFWMIPTYLNASEQGRLTKQDEEELKDFKLASVFFQRRGVLVKTPDKGYDWTEDSKQLYDAWYDGAVAIAAPQGGSKQKDNTFMQSEQRLQTT